MTIEQYPSSNNIATTTVWKYTATGSELTLSGYDNYSQALQFTAGSEQVYLNGVLLVRNLDYTPAANGLSITFPSSLAYNDFVQIYCYSNYSIASVASSSITGLIQNAQLTNSSITIGNQSISLGNAITTLTGTSISGSTNTLTNIPNSALSNSTIIINGNPISLGGTVNITTPNTYLANKGGLIVGTGGGSVTQVTPGVDGTIFTASSSQTSGTTWSNTINLNGTFGVDTSGNITNSGNINTSGSFNSSNYSMAGKNTIINGGFDIWQRGTDGTGSTYVSADRWLPDWVNPTYTGGVSGRLVRNTDAPPGLLYSCSWYSAAATGFFIVQQAIESYNAAPLAGKTVTISFYIKKIASISGGVLQIAYDNGGTSQDLFSGSLRDQNRVTVVNDVSNIPTSWTRYSTTITAPANAINGWRVGVYLNGIAGVASSGIEVVRVTGVQVETGSVATPFSRAGGTLQGELALCMRYYEKSYPQGINPGNASEGGAIYSFSSAGLATTGNIGTMLKYNVEKRTNPTLTAYDASGTSGKCGRYTIGSATTNGSTVNFANTTATTALIYSSGVSAQGILFHFTADAEL